MKVLLLNGSPRQGNTRKALKIFRKGLHRMAGVEIDQVDAADTEVSPCIACEQCGSDSQCIFDDDTNEIINSVVKADAVVFATPVYWWGMTAQMKLIIDKFYSQSRKLHDLEKKVGVIVIGEAEQSDMQYEIIPKQFQCICDYLGWDIVFSRTYTAAEPDDLEKDEAAMKEIEGLWTALE